MNLNWVQVIAVIIGWEIGKWFVAEISFWYMTLKVKHMSNGMDDLIKKVKKNLK